MSQPFLARWNGAEFEPHPRFRRFCDETFVIGQLYTLIEEELASDKQRRFYFAAIREAWKNLPEELGLIYPTADTLRKKALIATGWREERMFVAPSKTEARNIAAFMAPIDTDSVVDVNECVVRIWTARSQKRRAMNKQEFRKSVDDVLGFCAGLIGVEKSELEKAGNEQG